jgi:KDO2-lipid IV(A) lauroyltransferase
MMAVNVKRITDFLVYLVLRTFFCLIQTVRLERCHSVAKVLAYLACDVFKIRRSVVNENLQSVFPQLSDSERHQLSREMWEHLFLMICEIAQIPRKVHDTNWRKYVKFRNRPEVVRYLLDPRPTVLVSGHFGNFEIASYLSGLFGFRAYAVARTLDNPFLNDFVNRFRESKGQFILPKDGSANQVADILKAGGTLSILADQHAGPKGCWVDFMGRPASCHKALALFTLVSGAPMVVVTCTRRGGPMQFEMTGRGVADPATLDPNLTNVPALTQWYNSCLENAIRENPGQYWWVHRRWRDAPPKKKRAA